jgi:hypothetical protein
LPTALQLIVSPDTGAVLSMLMPPTCLPGAELPA